MSNRETQRILTLLRSGRRRNKAVLLLKNGEQGSIRVFLLAFCMTELSWVLATERACSLPGILDGCAVTIGVSFALYLYYTTLLHSSMHLIREIADRSRS